MHCGLRNAVELTLPGWPTRESPQQYLTQNNRGEMQASRVVPEKRILAIRERLHVVVVNALRLTLGVNGNHVYGKRENALL